MADVDRPFLSLARAPRLLQPGAAPLLLPALDAALLVWLALEGPTPRARLAALLWPHSDAEAARNSLRQRLFKLRRLCGRDLVSGATVLALSPDIEHDLLDADAVLGDEPPGIGTEFDTWLEQQRGRCRERVRATLLEMVEMAERARAWPDALQHAQALLALAPLSEEAHRRLMRLHYLAQDRAAALLAFDRCEQLLKDEIGTRPSAETLALLQTIEQSAPAGVPTTVPAAVLRPPRLIGRDAERNALVQAWAGGHVALLSGDGGLGKTRLLGELMAAMSAEGRPKVLMLSARPGDQGVAYASVSRLLRALPRPALQALDAPLRQELARLLPELGEAPPLATEAQRARFFNAVAALFDEPRLGIAGCLVDDLQFADDASVELLRYAAGAHGRWVVAARAAELAGAGRAWFDALLATPEALHLPLQPLDLARVAELVDSLGIASLRGADLAPALWRHTGGNPLYLLETLKAWLAQGSAELPARLPAASGVNALIGQRISQLSLPAVRLARCAAVAAPDFSIELAAQVLGSRTLDLADPWAELEAAQVLRSDGAFAHDLIYEAALASVPAAVARQLHAEIAAFLDARGGEPARLAAHHELAQQWPAAGRACLVAAERAQSAGRAVERAQFLARAAAAFAKAGDKAARFDALLQRAGVLAFNDLGLDAQAAVDELSAAAQGEQQQLQALATRLELAATRFEIDEALQLAPQAVQAARKLGQHELELDLAIIWSGVLGDARRTAEGVAVLDPYLDRMQADPDPARRWTYWEARSLALDYAGRLPESIQGWMSCQALARAAARPDWLWRSMSNAAAGQAKMGRVAQACELSAQARQIALSTGEVGRVRLLQMQMPHAHRLRDVGRYAEALPLLEESLQGLQAEGSANDVTMCAQRLALLYLFLGQPARAQRTLALARPGVPPGVAMFQRVLEAELALASGGDALTPMREALAMASDPNDVFHRIATLFASRVVPADEGEALAASLAVWASVQGRQGLAMSAHARAAAAALAAGAPRRALPHAEAALALVQQHQPESFYLPEVWLAAGRVHAALGHDAAAQQAFADGRRWVMAAHDQQVPEAWREAFLVRNPINRELLALAARQALTLR
jgi:DNA-binding SARP family transcriptional activator